MTGDNQDWQAIFSNHFPPDTVGCESL